MAKKNSINRLIEDLDYIEKNFTTLFSKQMDDIVAQLIVEIGKTTAYDTGYVRELLSNILLELGRIDLVSQLECEVYEFWNKLSDRRNGNSSYNVDTTIIGSVKQYNITVEDQGFYNQQQGEVSEIHPRQDENVIPYNVDYIQDKLETGGNAALDVAIEDFVYSIINRIERGR